MDEIRIRNHIRKSEQGFTFVEVVIALTVLVSALTILLGLQSSLIDRAVVERQQREGIRIARTILSAVEARESSGEPLEIGQYEGTPDDLLEGILPGSTSENVDAPFQEVEEDPDQFISTIQSSLNVQYWGIPGVNDQAMKRIELRLGWGERPSERLQFLFFIPFDEDDVTIDDEEE